MQWDNAILSNLNNVYVKEAISLKKWAFVSDYLRLHLLSIYGGIYVDIDVEITHCIDNFLTKSFFTGFEKYENNISPVTAVMGAEINNVIISDLLSLYDNINFFNNGEVDMTTNTVRISDYFMNKYNISNRASGHDATCISNNCYIYPYYYFCKPIHGKMNYAIHHFAYTWGEPYRRKIIFRWGGVSIIKMSYAIDVDYCNSDIYNNINGNVLYTMKFIYKKKKRLFVFTFM